jgi:conjugal transfer mating pair stabilization protein TraG
MIYEIYTFGGGEVIIEVLNAVVRIVGGNSFITAIKISLLFGMLATFFDIAVNGGFTKGVKYYVSFLLAYNILFVPRVDVLVTDSLNPNIQVNRKVDDVPFGIGFMGHTISALGNWLTKTFEMNFSLPDDLQYSKNGMLFGSVLVKQTLSSRVREPRVFTNFNNYIRQCTFASVQLGKTKLEDVIASKDVKTFLKYGSNGVLAYEYIDLDGEKSNKLCNDTGVIESEMGAESKKIQTSLNGKDTALEYAANIKEDAEKIFEQTLVMNAIEDSTQDYLALTEAEAAATNYAITKDDLQRKQAGIMQWLQANKYLPVLKITIECMFYALFPIAILLTMLPNGFKIFKSYVMILISLQMWSPLYAVLNLIMTLEQRYRIGEIMKRTGDSISLLNKAAIFDISQGIATQAGLMAWSIPVLAQKIVSGMERLAEVSGGIAQAGMHSTNQFAGEVSSGNMSYGNGSFKNTSYDNTNANKHDTTETHFSGTKQTMGGNGIIYNEYEDGTKTTNASRRNTSNLGVDFKTNESQVNSSATALREAKSVAETNAISYAKSLQEVENFQYSNNKIKGKTHTVSDSNTFKYGGGIHGGLKGFSIGGDYEKIKSWANSNITSEEERRTFMSTVDKARRQEQSYNQSVQDQITKERNLNYAKNTSVNSTLDANNEVERHLREDKGWTQEKLDDAIKNNPREIEKIGREHLSNLIFNTNSPEMNSKFRNTVKSAEESNQNQNKMIDNQYQYQKYDRTYGKAAKQMQNVYNLEQGSSLKTKKDTNDN